MPVWFQVTGGSRPLPGRVEAGLYRIAQEAVGNAVRHAGARTIRLKLLAQPGQVRLLVIDDGRGFDATAIPKDRYGLAGINERVHLLGGQLNLQTSPGRGTRVEVRVPLDETPCLTRMRSASSSPTITPWCATGWRRCWAPSPISR